MTLQDFLAQTRASVHAEVERGSQPGSPFPFPELIFAELVMTHLSEIGMCNEPVLCHFTSKLGNATLRLSGYAVSEDGDQLDLFVSLFGDAETVSPVPDAETRTAAEQCLRFLTRCVEGRLAAQIDPADDAHALAVTIRESYPGLDQIRIFVLTDRQARSKSFKSREISGKTVKLEVMDIERLHRHWSEGKPRDELVVNFDEVCGGPLPCVYVPADGTGYDYALTVIPGEALSFVYDKFGARLLEANVRSFLSATGKVNRGIRDTLREQPDRFMAYNNGIVVVADEAHLARSENGGSGLVWLKGMQIVNGGQTTASIYFTKKRAPSEVDLRRVRVPAKVIILRSDDVDAEEQLIADISRYANSQNSVKVSDLSANKPFHVELEKLAQTTYCPDGVGRWFYERAAGSYNVMLAREGTTPARLRQLKEAIPTSRRFSKTDLAKYLNAWNGRPEIVSLGAQKNFERFTAAMADQPSPPLPDVQEFKRIVAKAILFRAAHRATRAHFQQVQAQLAAYTVALVARRLGSSLSLDQIWQQQTVSAGLEAAMAAWAGEAYDVIRETGGERLPSEWVKRPECWAAVQAGKFKAAPAGLRELAV